MVEVVVPVRVWYLLCVSVRSDRSIAVTTDNDIGAEGAIHIGHGIKACTALTTLNLSGMKNVSHVQIAGVTCRREMLLLLCQL